MVFTEEQVDFLIPDMGCLGLLEEEIADLERSDTRYPFAREQVELEFPKMDFVEAPEAYFLRVEVPGFSKDKLEVRFEKGALTIKGKRSLKEDGGRFLHRERFDGEFVRNIHLPEDIIAERIHADFSNGILSIVIPKKEASRIREIKIRS